MRALSITYGITQRDKPLNQYLSEISKYKLLTHKQESQLTAQIKKGDDDALEKLVNANLRFVVSEAKQYQNNHLSLNDLINEGNLGLIRAAQKFDETRGFKFISYAVWYVRTAIMQGISEQAQLIRLPASRFQAYSKITRAFQSFEQKYQREPTDEELCEAAETTKTETAEYLLAAKYVLSTDSNVPGTEDLTLHDTLHNHHQPNPHDHLEQREVEGRIAFLLRTLPEREQQIMISYFGLDGAEPMSLQEIGDELNITRERIRQIKEACMAKLKPHIYPAMLQVYNRPKQKCLV